MGEAYSTTTLQDFSISKARLCLMNGVYSTLDLTRARYVCCISNSAAAVFMFTVA